MYKNFPYNSPYAFCENKVVNGIELEGLEHIFYAFVTDKKTSQISIVEVSRIDATVKLITGQVVNYNTSEKSYILGSDGNFHEIPEAWLNRSLLPYDESLEKSMNRINSWKLNNQAFKISENVKALQGLSEQANVYLGVIFFASGIKGIKGGANLTKAQLKSISSLKSQIAQHKKKLAEYIKDPMKFDNKGFLKNAPNDAVRQKIIQTRINHLNHEIQTFQKNIKKILNGK